MKRALVTGGSGGIGAAICRQLAAQGCDVLVHANGNIDRAEAVAAAIRAAGGAARAIAFDVTDEAATRAALEKELAAGAIQVLVNNAGIHADAVFAGMSREKWASVIDVSLNGFYNVTQPLTLPMLRTRWGRIVNITSGAVKAPIDILGLSNGARTGLTGFIAGLARQSRVASRNVTINNLLPGPFDTDRLRATMIGAAQKSGQPLEAVMDARRKLNPTQRFGTADEFGAACAFLCSAHAGYINGQNVLMDGGAYPGTF